NKILFYLTSCVVAGSGTLGIPYALSQSGWIGMVFLILSACISHYTGCLIIRCLYLGQSKRLNGFPEIGYTAFGRPGQVIGFIFSQLLLFATPIVYFILASSNISDLLLSAGILLDFKVCAWMVSVVVGVPFVMIRSMRDVSFMSVVATLASVSLVLIISVASTADYRIENDTDIQQNHHHIAIPRQFPMAFSTFSFSYCGNVIYPHLEGCMNHPRHWSKVLMVATIIVTVMYVIIGFVCYLVYGNQVLNPVFLNLPYGSSRNIAMIITTIHVLLASPLYLYVFTIRIESWLGLFILFLEWLCNHPILARVLVRSLEIAVCALFAMLIPYFADVMNLIGTIAAESLTFVLPCAFFIKL
ncbi:transmembrane amino acid transporter protein-domain-containing protein, partial [Halteromyces radiatus]|uniref:transmembrane amino acid transporter protein-domain-containing protein n=1 Tax=Halteromyces radiatus TaxID=101107 RepID=UPI00221FB0F6